MDSKTNAPVIVRCASCGAGFDSNEPKCPYCGTMYEPGAEAHYMNRLGDIKEEMEDLSDLALSETTSELKHVVRKTFITIAVVLLVIAALAGLYELTGYFSWYYRF